ncbi:MAG: 30S ribosomal protein S16 [Acidimicrobiales bacterium]
MAVKLRLKRMGKKKQPTYRIVAADSRSPRDGRFIEAIGTYAPRADPSLIEVDNAKAIAWLVKGAKASETVRKILEISGAWGEFAALRPAKPAKPARKKSEAAKKRAAARKPTKKAAKKAEKKPEKKPAKKRAATVEAPAEPEAPEATPDAADVTPDGVEDNAETTAVVDGGND